MVFNSYDVNVDAESWWKVCFIVSSSKIDVYLSWTTIFATICDDCDDYLVDAPFHFSDPFRLELHGLNTLRKNHEILLCMEGSRFDVHTSMLSD